MLLDRMWTLLPQRLNEGVPIRVHLHYHEARRELREKDLFHWEDTSTAVWIEFSK